MDWRDITDDREKYQAYLCSREWAEKKEAVKERARWTCERFGLHNMYAVHHLTYARKYSESLDDLQGICDLCHDYIHGKTNRDPLDAFKRPKLPHPEPRVAPFSSEECERQHVELTLLESHTLTQEGELEILVGLIQRQRKRQGIAA